MIVVRVELWSANSGKIQELARMIICNDETGTFHKRNYQVATLRGRSREDLDRSLLKRTHSREGVVRDHPSPREHVWNLVAKALSAMNYG